jgi:hypothetical protein
MRTFLTLAILVVSIVSLRSHKLTKVDEILRKLKHHDNLGSSRKYQDVKYEEKSFKTIQNILLRLHRSISFFEDNFDSINVDGLYGLRIAEGNSINFKFNKNSMLNFIQAIFFKGSIHNLVNTLKSQSKLTSSLIANTLSDESLIDIIYDRLSNLNKRVYNSIGKDSPNYANDFDLLINKPFTSGYSNDLQKKLMYSKYAEKSKDLTNSFDEPFSDSCYSLLMKNNNLKENCETKHECFDFFTDPKASGKFFNFIYVFADF